MECYVRKHDKLVRHLDMCIEEVSREYARVTMPITENHKNGMGVAHGGAPEEMETVRQMLTEALPNSDHLWDGEIDGTLSVYIGDGVLGAAVQVLD